MLTANNNYYISSATRIDGPIICFPLETVNAVPVCLRGIYQTIDVGRGDFLTNDFFARQE